MEKLLSVKEAAARLGVSRVRVYEWIRQGRMEVVYVNAPFGKRGKTKERLVQRIPESKCLIPRYKKHGPKTNPEAKKLVKAPSKFPEHDPTKNKHKKKKPKRTKPVELK